MCQRCRDEIREVLIGLLTGEHELIEQARETIRVTVEAMRQEGVEIPEGMEHELLEAAIAGQVAIGAAHMAAKTKPEMTEEGGLDVPLILGLWAGALVQGRVEAHAIYALRQLLGMGDN